ncbi:hypothetical protein ACLVWU_15885 [Bdellovibrio sp. HCB290]|uniref:hypothetical protein n=1 Tax=Bdellovibrio sp. HCB290 TaxID=3394356 RepID=UPI0039B6B9CD
MKLFIALLATVVAFSAQAADQKLGNVILVEREIPNPYELCVKNVIDKTDKKQSSFYCVIKYTKASIETPVGRTSPITYVKENCKVRSETGNGNMMLAFGTEKEAVDFETARACLLEGLTAHGRLTVKVMTIE